MESEKINNNILRKKAEDLVRIQFEGEQTYSKDVDELLYELRVHQIELEMQNDELMKTQLKLEDSRLKYFDLYNFAPAGYFTLDKKGIISEVNLAGAKLLGFERSKINKTAFILYIEPKQRNMFHHHMMMALETGTKQSFELKLLESEDNSFYAHLEIVVVQDVHGNFKEFSIIASDIQDIKNKETALRKSESYSEIFFNDHTVMMLIDPNNGDIVDANPAAVNFYGYTHDELIKMKISDIRISNADIVSKEMQKAAANQKNHFIFKHRLANGEIRDVDVYSGLIKQESKNLLYSIIHDITEQKKLESKLKESENKFRTFFENIMDAVLLTIPDGTILAANPATEKLFGYTEEEICKIGRNGLVDIEDPNLSIIIEEMAHKGKAQGELTYIKKDGSKFPGEISISVFIDGNGNERTSMTIRDITKRRQIEEALKKSERSLAEAQHIAHIGSWEWNIKTGDITWSNELYSIYGVNPNTFTPTLSSFGDYMHPDDEEYVNQHVDQILSENKPHNFDFRIILDDGSIRVLNTVAEVTKFDKNGEPKIIIGINQDITERKKIELKLNENIKKLAQSNKELEQFAYITSHDLREPLRMITSFLQLLEKRYKDQLDQDANEFIGFAVNGAKRLDTMTKDLLKYSQITHKKGVNNTVNFEHVLEHALTNLKVQIEENNAIITHDPLPTIYGNEELKIQLFQNIIANAIKYRSQETPKIHISATKEKNQYLFSIKDNGIGMSSRHIEKIFTIFQRLHTNDEYEGTGIGLAIAQKIVHQQGGQIWVESEPGKGSKFYFTIPNK